MQRDEKTTLEQTSGNAQKKYTSSRTLFNCTAVHERWPRATTRKGGKRTVVRLQGAVFAAQVKLPELAVSCCTACKAGIVEVRVEFRTDHETGTEAVT